MSHRRTKNRGKRKQRGRGVGAVMALLAPVLAKTVASMLASQAISGIGKSLSAASGRPKLKWYK